MGDSSARADQGFTLVELLVVIIIIGVLAAVAVPMYLEQKAKGYDATAQQDLQVMANSVRGALENEPTLPAMTTTGQTYAIGGVDAGAMSPGTVFGGLSGTDMFDWCLDVTHPQGDVARSPGFRYSATDGLEAGACP